MMRSVLSFGFCLFSLVLVSACSLSEPMPWGRGYSSYAEPYKSAPGPDVREIGYAYDFEKNQSVQDEMVFAASDLVDKLSGKVSVSEAVYLHNPVNTAFYNSFDHVLRGELMERGYRLASSTRDGATRLDFVARQIPEACGGVRYDYYQRSYLALAIGVDYKTPADVVGGFYEVPFYDYVGARHVKLVVPACADGMKNGRVRQLR